MATYYADHGTLGRRVHAGLNCVKSKYTYSTTASAGDIVRFCKLPNNCTVTSVVFYGDLPNSSATTYKVGTDSSVARFYVSSSAITVLHNCTLIGTSEATRGIGYTFSASDDASNQWEYISATVLNAGTATPGDSITAIIQYVVTN